ncbi:MAG: integration host factor subunit alpha [Desulfobacteraceae bacterium]|nr:MAG: integration host factor subunit alpha [Desulfobacteraceae bacterium]
MASMTKDQIARMVAEKIRLRKRKRERQQFLFPEMNQLPLTRKRASAIVNTLFEIMARALERGDFVIISGFGKFQVKFKWARKGRNPRTGESIVLESRRVVTFHASKRMRTME